MVDSFPACPDHKAIYSEDPVFALAALSFPVKVFGIGNSGSGKTWSCEMLVLDFLDLWKDLVRFLAPEELIASPELGKIGPGGSFGPIPGFNRLGCASHR